MYIYDVIYPEYIKENAQFINPINRGDFIITGNRGYEVFKIVHGEHFKMSRVFVNEVKIEDKPCLED